MLDLDPGDVDPGTVRTLNDLIVVTVGQVPSVQALSGDDVRRMIALQAERQQVGCDDDTECLTELADALGAQLVLSGRAGQLGDRVVLNLNLLDVGEAKAIGRRTIVIKSMRKAPKLLEREIKALFAEAQLQEAGTSSYRAARQRLGLSIAGLGAVTTLLASVAVLVSAVPYVQHGRAREALLRDRSDLTDAPDVTTREGLAQRALEHRQAMEESGALWNGLGRVGFFGGLALASVGVAMLGGGAAWAWTGAQE